MVASNVSMILIPLNLSCYPSDNIFYLPFNSLKPMRTIGMIWRPSNAKKIVLEQIITQIRSVMSQKEIVKVINIPISCFENKRRN